MKSLTIQTSLLIAFALAATILLASIGCNSGQVSGKTSKQKTSSGSQLNDTQNMTATANNGDINLNCIVDHIQNPPESFHYTFTNVSDNPWHEDADVTPQNIDGSFMNNSLPKPQEFHGPPRAVSSNLMAIGRMADTFATVHATAAVLSQGGEKKNGYDTTKLSIDTARGSVTEQRLFRTLLGASGFEKGTVWVTSEGCPVQIALDEQLQTRNGSVSTNHYEEAMVKKP